MTEEIVQEIGTLKWNMATGTYLPLESLERIRAVRKSDTEDKEVMRANVDFDFVSSVGETPGQKMLFAMKYVASHILVALETKRVVGNVFLYFIVRDLNNSLKIECRAHKEKA